MTITIATSLIHLAISSDSQISGRSLGGISPHDIQPIFDDVFRSNQKGLSFALQFLGR